MTQIRIRVHGGFTRVLKSLHRMFMVLRRKSVYGPCYITHVATMAGAGAGAAGSGGDGGGDCGGDGGGGCGGGGGGGSLRQHARREAVSMCTTRQGGCAWRACRSAHRSQRDEVVDDGPKPGTHEESNPTDLRSCRKAVTPAWGQIERNLG